VRQNRIANFAEYALYPILIAVMVLVIADETSPLERALVLVIALGGALLWALIGRLLHRFLLQVSAPAMRGSLDRSYHVG
jgi:hypothetical protein